MKNAPPHDWIIKSGVTLTGDERHGFEWSEEKGPTTANKMHNLWRGGKQVSFDFKLSVIDEINNGLISTNYASKKYNISRSTIDYWRKG